MKKRFLKWSIALPLLVVIGLTNVTIAKESTKYDLTEAPKNMTWVNIVVQSNDTTLEDLGSTYYGDVKEATLIYNANREVIPKSKKLKKGMKLKMPVTSKYIDQPEHLGWN